MLPIDIDLALTRTRDGDLAAFEFIVRRFQKPLASYLLRLVGDRELAADLLQDTFLDLFRNLQRVDGQQVSGWLYRAATNNALSVMRRRRRWLWLPLDWFSDHSDQRASLETVTGERLAVRQALTKVRRDQAICLLLHDVAGFSCAEIAEQQQITLAAAKQRVARGRRAFLAAYGTPAQSSLFQTEDQTDAP